MIADLYGHMGSIHPMDKTPVGKRLALAARQHAYGEKVIAAGPKPISATVKAQTLTLSFAPETVGAKGLLLRTEGKVRQLAAVGEKQISGNPVNDTVPPAQCGPASGFEVLTAGVWRPVPKIALSKDAAAALELTTPPGGESGSDPFK